MIDISQEKEDSYMRWANDSNGKPAYITNVRNGLDCNCTCIKCKRPVIAKNNVSNVRAAHFAHYGDYAHENNRKCDGKCDEIMLHMVAEEIIKHNKCVMLPNYLIYQAKKIDFVEVEIEERKDRSDMQPDIVGVTAEGDRILIEILNTHSVDSAKLKKICEDNLMCLEIDISKETQDTIEKFLLEDSRERVWLNNPKYLDKAIEELKIEHPNLKEYNASFCQDCTQYDVCKSEKYVLGEAMRDGKKIVLCGCDKATREKTSGITDKKQSFNYLRISTESPQSDEATQYAEPIQFDLFGEPIQTKPVEYPFEPSGYVQNPLEKYFEHVNGKKDCVFHNAKKDKFRIIMACLYRNSLKVETYGEKLYKQYNTYPFRVYVIKYDSLHHKFNYTIKEFKGDDESGANAYTREYN